jgi:hypothetical protein
MIENDWSGEVSYPKIQSGGIRVVRQNQRIRRRLEVENLFHPATGLKSLRE